MIVILLVVAVLGLLGVTIEVGWTVGGPKSLYLRRLRNELDLAKELPAGREREALEQRALDHLALYVDRPLDQEPATPLWVPVLAFLSLLLLGAAAVLTSFDDQPGGWALSWAPDDGWWLSGNLAGAIGSIVFGFALAGSLRHTRRAERAQRIKAFRQ